MGQGHTWNIAFGFDASLTIMASLFLGIKHTVYEYETGLLNLEYAKKKLSLDIKKTFYNLILLNEHIKLTEQNLATAEKRYVQAELKYNSGSFTEYAKLSAQVAWENIKPGLEDLKMGYQTAILAFKQTIGLDRTDIITLNGTIEEEPVNSEYLELGVLLDMVENRLDIQGMRNIISTLENIKKLALSTIMPSVTFSFSVDPTFSKNPFRDSWFENTEEDWVQQSGMFAITLSIPLDGLLPYSKAQVQIHEAEDSIEQAGINLAMAIQGARLEIETLVMTIKKSITSIESLKLNVQLANRAYEMAEEAYASGNRDLLEVQNAELEFQKAKLEALKEYYTFKTSLLELEFAINLSLESLFN